MSGSVECDLTAWMPGHGENGLAVSFEGRDLKVVVRFDGQAGQETSKVLRFEGVSFYSVGAMPGVSSIAGKFDCDFQTGKVIETENSELSAQWVEHWEKSGFKRRCAHFVMFWGAENKAIHVIAESVGLS
jgi:uncharacterized protein YhdP